MCDVILSSHRSYWIGIIILLEGSQDVQAEHPGWKIVQNGRTREHWRHQMLRKMRSNRNPPSLLVGMQNGAAVLRRLAISYKTKRTLTVWPSGRCPWYLPKWVENLFHTKPSTLALLVLTAETWKLPRCPSVGEWINKLWCPDSGLLFSAKKKPYQAMERRGGILDGYY